MIMKIIKNRYVLLTIILLVISFLLCSKSFNDIEKEELLNSLAIQVAEKQHLHYMRLQKFKNVEEIAFLLMLNML